MRSRQLSEPSAGAARLVGPGGRLIVISCSLEEDENEAVVAPLLEEELGLEPLAVEQMRSLTPAASLTGFVERAGLWRLWTAGDHDGFTVQVFGRSGHSKPRKR